MHAIASRKDVMAIDCHEGGFKIHAVVSIANNCHYGGFQGNGLPGRRIHNCQ
jgi:hypothetical protein